MKIFAFVLTGLMLAVSGGAQVKSPMPPAVKKPFAESLQAFVVTTKDWNAVQGTGRLFERKSLKSNWSPIGESFPVVVGRNGLAWAVESAPELASEFKKEGDGRAPAGMFPLAFAFGAGLKSGGGDRLPFSVLNSYTECVDDVNSSFYNRIVDRDKVGNFDWKSSEKMLEVSEQYELGVFVGYNSYPVRKGDGSCIFLHIWKDAESGTAGCTAMTRGDLERIIGRLNPTQNPYLVQLPEEAYKTHQKSWNLPKL